MLDHTPPLPNAKSPPPSPSPIKKPRDFQRIYAAKMQASRRDLPKKRKTEEPLQGLPPQTPLSPIQLEGVKATATQKTTPVFAVETLAEELVQPLQHIQKEGSLTTIVRICSEKYPQLQIEFTRYTTDPESMHIQLMTSSIQAQQQLQQCKQSLELALHKFTKCSCHIDVSLYPLTKGRSLQKGIEKTRTLRYPKEKRI